MLFHLIPLLPTSILITPLLLTNLTTAYSLFFRKTTRTESLQMGKVVEQEAKVVEHPSLKDLKTDQRKNP